MNFLDERLRPYVWRQLQPCPMTGCWLWTGKTTPSGYGLSGKRPTRLVHRLAYEAFIGPIPDGLEIDHRCRVRCCANPVHLEAVSHRENLLRGDTFAARNTKKTHCPRGHEYAGSNLYVSPSGRKCRACHRERAAARFQANRESVLAKQRAARAARVAAGWREDPETRRRIGRRYRQRRRERAEALRAAAAKEAA